MLPADERTDESGGLENGELVSMARGLAVGAVSEYPEGIEAISRGSRSAPRGQATTRSFPIPKGLKLLAPGRAAHPGIDDNKITPYPEGIKAISPGSRSAPGDRRQQDHSLSRRD